MRAASFGPSATPTSCLSASFTASGRTEDDVMTNPFGASTRAMYDTRLSADCLDTGSSRREKNTTYLSPSGRCTQSAITKSPFSRLLEMVSPRLPSILSTILVNPELDRACTADRMRSSERSLSMRSISTIRPHPRP